MNHWTALQYCKLELLSEPSMQLAIADLGLFQHVPHVMLHFEDDTDLSIPAGSWQSLDVSGANRVDVVFSDLGAFLSRTKEFVFESAYRWDEGPAMYQLIPGACKGLGLQCYECTAVTIIDGDGLEQVCHRLSNGQTAVHASCQGLCDDSLRGTATEGRMHLVEEEDFWPKQNMHSRVFGN